VPVLNSESPLREVPLYTSIKVRVRQLQPHSEALVREEVKPPLTLEPGSTAKTAEVIFSLLPS